MAKAKAKSVAANPPVDAFIAGDEDPSRCVDCRTLLDLMRAATGCEPRMWGDMVGFGELHYRYDSGREGDTFVLGFESRKADLTLYLGPVLAAQAESLGRLGKHKV